ncbi:MAG: ester cyclase [Thermomicrobiales bacterium]|nr:ester cyclase [Thermomicrobiales bacterium]
MIRAESDPMTSWLSNLRVRFLLLVLATTLPALGLLIVSANEQRDQALETARANTRGLARLAAADQQRQIEATRQLLIVLARLPEVREGDAECDELLADLIAQFPLYANLGVIAPDGELVCSAVTPSQPINLGDRAYFQNAVSSGDFSIGEYQESRVTGKPVFNLGYPILDAGGGLIGVVYAAIDLAALGQFVDEAELPADAIVTVYDRGGSVLVRQPEDPDEPSLVGVSLAGTPVVDQMLAEGSGVAEGREHDRTYLYAFSSLGGANHGNAYITIAVPKASVTAPAEEAFDTNLTRLGLVVAVVLVGAWVGGDLLVRRNTEANKALVRRVYEAFNSGGVDLLDEVVATSFHDRDPLPGQAPGLAGLKQAVGLFRAAFPDGEMIVEELIAEGHKVVARVHLKGTQSGDFAGTPATGRAVSADGIEVFRISHGKIVEGWSRFAHPATEPENYTPVG